MVSLRRRRLLGLCSGLPDSAVAPCPMYFDDEGVAQFGTRPGVQINAHPIPPTKENEEITNSSTGPDSFKGLASNSSEHQNEQGDGYGSNLSKQQHDQPSLGQQDKPRNRDRRKHVRDQELSPLRGVYFKNMRWQAAIKVNKKQVHLGTLESQEAAARVYDRAAFICGRAPNFELPEEDKQELRQLQWDEFLRKTRVELCNKRRRKQSHDAGSQGDFQNEPGQGAEGTSASKVAELE